MLNGFCLVFLCGLLYCQAWSSWSRCSVTCGDGFRTRRCNSSLASCVDGIYDVDSCQETACNTTENVTRNYVTRTTDQRKDNLTHWLKWSPCSNLCGVGIQARKGRSMERNISRPTYNLRACVGQSSDCTKKMVKNADQQQRTDTYKEKTSLYRRLGVISILIVGFTCCLFFVSILVQLKSGKASQTG